MLIKIGYNIALKICLSERGDHLLHVHPSRGSHLVEPERFGTEEIVDFASASDALIVKAA
jgi:hypothetical protein